MKSELLNHAGVMGIRTKSCVYPSNLYGLPAVPSQSPSP
jgi:hypothetical protein